VRNEELFPYIKEKGRIVGEGQAHRIVFVQEDALQMVAIIAKIVP